VLEREVLERELPARADADAGEPGADALLFRAGRRKLQRGVEELEKLGLDQILLEPGPGDIGCTRYPSCTRMTFGMSAALNRCVRKMASEKSVDDRNTLPIPAGVSPFQRGPTTR